MLRGDGIWASGMLDWAEHRLWSQKDLDSSLGSINLLTVTLG